MLAISIIIPSYKPEAYLSECLVSLANQTLDITLYEIILVLNGPREPYIADLMKYAKQYPNIVLLYTEVASVSYARNKGLDAAKGEYICFIDDDDIVSSNYLSSLLAKVNKTNIVVADVKNFAESISQYSDDYISIAYKKFRQKDKESIFLKRSFLSSACCKIIPREIIGNFRFNTNFKIGEDALFMFSISKGMKKVELADDAIYYRRCRVGSASRRKQTISFKLKNSLLQILEYTNLYFRSPFQYNFFLYLSRIVASSLHVVK